MLVTPYAVLEGDRGLIVIGNRLRDAAELLAGSPSAGCSPARRHQRARSVAGVLGTRRQCVDVLGSISGEVGGSSGGVQELWLTSVSLPCAHKRGWCAAVRS